MLLYYYFDSLFVVQSCSRALPAEALAQAGGLCRYAITPLRLLYPIFPE
jgi:hypothetical protein